MVVLVLLQTSGDDAGVAGSGVREHFSGRHYPKDVILWVVRWYCRSGVSYRNLEEMLTH